MEQQVEQVLRQAVEKLRGDGTLPPDFAPVFLVERPRNRDFGDFGCALPLAMAKATRRSPADCAKVLIAAMDVDPAVFDTVAFAPPGYVNFRCRTAAWFAGLADIVANPQGFGTSNAGNGERVLLEFVSANPTGPLHVGHARGAILGDALARILRAAGFAVQTEYYVNDVGNQMGMLGRSLHARARQALSLPVEFPEKGYHGDYVVPLAEQLAATEEGHALVAQDFDALDEEARARLSEFGGSRLLARIRDDLEALGIRFDQWFSEKSLHASGRILAAVEELVKRDAAYRREDGAVLFRMAGKADEDDRVILRDSGVPTYFAADIAYHREKLGRGFERLINIWGADHHGYIPRMRAAVEAFGHAPDALDVLLVQMVTLTRNGVVVPMSKRSGEFVTLREVVDEVGPDAMRFIFLLRHADSQMEFDLELAKAQTMDNPVYYVQYGHARAASILRRAAAQGVDLPASYEPAFGEALVLPEELALAQELTRFPGVVASAASRREPHHVAFYLMELVKSMHSYYTRNKHTQRVISEDVAKTRARVFLIGCVKVVLARGLGLLGVTAPEEMRTGVEE